MKLYEKIINGQQRCKPASKIIIIKDDMQIFNPTEEMLLEDMPIIPIVFNQDAYVISKDLSNVGHTYFGTRIFTKTKQKNYQDYLPKE